jgi:hypothetical protein
MSALRNAVCRCAVALLALVLAPSAPLSAQQDYIARYDAFVGYAFLNSASLDLFEPGVAMQFGFRPKTWMSFGVDCTIASGPLTLVPSLLPDDLRARLTAQLGQLAAAGRLPAGYQLTVPAHSDTQTFAVGPQLAYRGMKRATLFLRPLFAGAIREVATPKPTDAIATLIVQQLAPTGRKRDWQGFFGVGGGFDIIASKHFALRAQGDIVYDHLFNDLLKNGRWTVRFSVGPAFNFGRNIR